MRAPFLAVMAVITAACANASAPGASSNLDGEWREATRGLNAPTITFEGDRASGFAGCNRWFSRISRNGDALSFDGVGATRMMCDVTQMEIERRFIETLGNAEMARVDGDTLILSDIGGRELARFLRVR